MLQSVYAILDISACNAASAATTAVTVAGPIFVGELPHYSVTVISTATQSAYYSMEVSPFFDKGWTTWTACSIGSGSVFTRHDVSSGNMGWVRFNVCSTATVAANAIRFVITSIRDR